MIKWETKRVGHVRIQTKKEIAEVENLGTNRSIGCKGGDGSPSDKGGIKAGYNLEFGKKSMKWTNCPKIVADTDVGATVNVKVWRNKREVTKKITLGRLETSEDFKPQLKKEEKPKQTRVEGLKIEVRSITEKDIIDRELPKSTSGVVITKIDNDSPVNYLKEGNIIVEAQKRNINTPGDLNIVVNSTLRSAERTILIVIYNNQIKKDILALS